MTPQAPSIALVLVNFGIALVWLVFLKLIFNRLEAAHPQKYEAMGRPSLFLRNNDAAAWAIMKFLIAREHRTLNDKYLTKLSDTMLVFSTIYLLLFFYVFVFVLHVA
jgi:hypothetical protein